MKHGLLPACFYLLAFSLLTFPLMGKFSSVFFADPVDGLQNIWNIWWVNMAVRQPGLYPSIWYTQLLHWPYGTSLVGHTLNPFNGYVAVPLLSFFSLMTTYNTIVVFAFVMSGVTMYWLAYYLTRSYWASLVSGFLFTFSAYHFAHGGNQLQTASLEWIPLFLLAWYVLLTRPGPLIAVGAAVALWLVILCDYYYFTYCVLGAVLIFVWYALSHKSLRFITRGEYLVSLGVFAASALLLCGPLVVHLLLSNYRDPMVGAHDATAYSLDLWGLFIPGGRWLFNSWTQAYWSRLPGTVTESSSSLALPVFVFISYLWMKRKSFDPAARGQLYLWSSTAGFFFLLALGPALHVGGTAVWYKAMPYWLLGRVLPFLNLSGVPARMTVMVVLSTAIMSAFALRDLLFGSQRTRLLTLGLLAVVLFQTLPAPLATVTNDVPDYVTALAKLPDDGGGVLNLVKARSGRLLYYQTVYNKPMAFGYVARLPASVTKKDADLSNAIAANDYAALWDTYRIRYIVISDSLPASVAQPDFTLVPVYDKKGVMIYRLGCVCELEH